MLLAGRRLEERVENGKGTPERASSFWGIAIRKIYVCIDIFHERGLE